jgi:murein DD-endopeptidase MepM/ murein hydrolase activator NlpD
MKQYTHYLKPISCLSIACLLVAWIILPARVGALSPAQKKLFDSGVHYYDIVEDPLESACGTGASVTALTGSTPPEKVFNYLTGRGLSAPQAAGLMGNLAVESGFDPFNQQNGSPWPTGGWGIAQWTATRRVNNTPDKNDSIVEALLADPTMGAQFYIPTEEVGRTWPNEAARQEATDKLLLWQLNFMYNESTKRDPRNPIMPAGYLTNPGLFAGVTTEWQGLTKVPTDTEAVVYWEWNYERAGVPALGARQEAANGFMTDFGSNPAGGGGGVSQPNCSQSGAVVGDFAFPVPRNFFDTNPEWFTKPHHDYPAADIPVPTDTPVFSMTAGTVTAGARGGACGQGLTIDAGNGVFFTYCHGRDGGSIDGAREGDKVTAGQLIMHSDNTGHSTGPHLHLQIKLNGVNRCPQPLLEAIGDGTAIPAFSELPTSGCTN